MGLMRKLAKKTDSELLTKYFEYGGTITPDGFVSGGEHEARLSLMLLGSTVAGRKLLADLQKKFNMKQVSRRGDAIK